MSPTPPQALIRPAAKEPLTIARARAGQIRFTFRRNIDRNHPTGRRATRRGSSRRGPPEGLPQLGVLKDLWFYVNKTEKERRDEEEDREGDPGACNPPGWIFWSWGSRSAPGALLGGGPGPPYRPLLNSDNGNQPAMSSGRQGGPPPGAAQNRGVPGGVPGPPYSPWGGRPPRLSLTHWAP